jgi:hypothetical protein
MNIQFPKVLQLDVGGVPRQWLSYEDAAIQYAKENIAWELGESFTLHGGKSRMTGLQSTMDVKTIIAVKGADKSKIFHSVPRLTNPALFARDQYICAYCNREFKVGLTRDHVHPRSKGGADIWNNVVSACGRCNKKKDCKDIADINMQLHYIPYTPDRAEHLILQNRRILVDQMDFLRKCITNKKSRLLIDL